MCFISTDKAASANAVNISIRFRIRRINPTAHFPRVITKLCSIPSKQMPGKSPTKSIDAQLVDEVPKPLDDVLYSLLTLAL